MVWSVPAMLAISFLFGPGLLGFLLLAAALEGYLLKRPEELAAHAANRTDDRTATPVPQTEPPRPLRPVAPPPEPTPTPAPARAEPAFPVPFPIPAHLPSPPAATPMLHQPDQAEPITD